MKIPTKVNVDTEQKQSGAGAEVTALAESLQAYACATRQFLGKDLTDVSQITSKTIGDADCDRTLAACMKGLDEKWLSSVVRTANQIFIDVPGASRGQNFKFYRGGKFVNDIYDEWRRMKSGSGISGDDKCKYVVFSNEKDALEYEKSSVLKNACVVQNEPINKEAKLLSEKSKCLNGNQNLWFVFESDNWIMNQKIVFEVVPWVDYKFKNGWTNAAKKELLLEIENNEFFKSIKQKDKLLGYFIETFTSKYNFNNYREIIPAEKAKVFSDVMDESLKKSGLMNGYLDGIRVEAKRFLSAKEYEKGMSLIENDIIQKGRATDLDYGLQGDFYLMTKQYIKAEVAIKKAISMNATNIEHQLRLAHVYLFSNRISDAKDIHKKYRSNNVSSSKSWTQATKEDFENFKKNGLPTDDFKKILRILE
jgi:tetratricopeptide (TPR) repeat protein